MNSKTENLNNCCMDGLSCSPPPSGEKTVFVYHLTARSSILKGGLLDILLMVWVSACLSAVILDCLAVADFNLLGKRLRAERLGVIGGSLGDAPSFVAKRANQRCQQFLVTIP